MFVIQDEEGEEETDREDVEITLNTFPGSTETGGRKDKMRASLDGDIQITDTNQQKTHVHNPMVADAGTEENEVAGSTPVPSRIEYERYFVTITLWLVVVIIALIFKDVGVVMSLSGSVGASLAGFILPCLIYFGTYRAEYNVIYIDFVQPIVRHLTCRESLDGGIGEDTPWYCQCCNYMAELCKLVYHCAVALRPFYLAIFSGFAGVCLLFLGVFTVIVDYIHDV